MTCRPWLLFSAILTFAFGIASIVAPVWVGALYGNATDADAALWAQYYGSAVLCLSFITWSVRNLKDSELQRRMAMLLCLFYTINLVISLKAQLAGVVNYLGWSNIFLQSVLILALGYVGLVRSRRVS